MIDSKRRGAMELKKLYQGIKFIPVFLLFFLLVSSEAAAIKVKVIIDNASIQATREIGGKVLTRIPLNTILTAEPKRGEWYKVTWEKEGVTGFIHEMLVEEVSEREAAQPEAAGVTKGGKTDSEIIAEIQLKIEESKKLIRTGQEVDRAINSLRPLVAKTIGLSDQNRQKELSSEIYLWIGLGYCAQHDELSALREFRNMFEVDEVYAKEITSNILDSKVIALIQQAENEYKGLVTEYLIEISTEPKEAMIKIDGKEIGLSPKIARATIPKVVIEISKEGYKPLKDEVFITTSPTKKEYKLERAGMDVEVRSTPVGAKVYLDVTDTAKMTNCVLPIVPFGLHKLTIKKESYADWEGGVEVKEGAESILVEASLIPNKYQLVNKWGGPQSAFFKMPAAVTVDKENNIYLVDQGAIKLKKISAEGRLLTAWGNQGAEFKGLKSTGGIALDSQGNVFVTDAKNSCVLKFDKTGKFNKKWGTFGPGKLSFNIPLGIAVDSKDDIYIVDSGNSRIAKYSNAGALKKVWGAPGTTDGAFVYPVGVAVNQKDEVLVLDRGRVQKFSSEGDFISSWGKTGMGDGEFNKPNGIFVELNNCIYIADSGNNRIQKFDGNGKFIAKWGSTGTGDGQMMFPSGVAVDRRGYVYVVERDNNRLQVFGVVPSSE
jgi:DNA-binding beta-propeller fold protein YncE